MPPFRTKARAVDLLGKGQIADLPTAISELWKNGYDAYADNLSCDLYLKGYKDLQSPIFTLSDDGIGMSQKDIEDRWIVLGTDSKVRGIELLSESGRLGKSPRVPMGEKGIGRLSVSYLGSKMLMLTKKRNTSCSALFMDWDILENYNLFLDDVNIPIKEISSSTIKDSFYELIEEFKMNLQIGDWREHEVLKNKILSELDILQLPSFVVDSLDERFSNVDSHGTIFLIFDPHQQLIDLSYGAKIDVEDASTIYLRSSLSGIFNAFKNKRAFNTEFWIHDSAGKYDLIAKEDFFSKEDIFEADHWVTGSFDDDGFFTGEVQVYNQRFKHTFRARRPPGKTPYGPFKIEFGFIEGDAKNANMPRAKWNVLKSKCDMYGGIYIYRDEFRVLPYGRPEYDFLKFEERRSLSATYYQFSRRRICGYIEISRDQNPQLKDKAGREGFIVNNAYRDFQTDLIEFFVDFSVRYLRTITKDEKEKGVPLTIREEQLKSVQQQNERIIKAEKKRNKITATSFKRDLKDNSSKIDFLSSEVKNLYAKLLNENNKEHIVYNNIAQVISDAQDKKTELYKLKLSKPKRIQLTDNQALMYEAYRDKYNLILDLVIQCDDLISNTQEKLSQENLKEEFETRYRVFQKNLESMIKGYESRYNKVAEILSRQIKEDYKTYVDLFAEKTGPLIISDEYDKQEAKRRLELLENTHDLLRDEIATKYDSFIKHIEGLSFDIDDDLLVGWYKEQYEKINERVELLYELSQLGLAIEIIDHQFNVLYAEMSASIEFFHQFSKERPEIDYNFRQLKNAFEHLETNHKLLKPLYRTRRRSKSEITGFDIESYINEFFKNTFETDRIQLSTDESFRNYSFYTYESIVKPVFVNIINNAVYWLIPSKERRIHIAYENEQILIMNSGEKIDSIYLDTIFTLFFTRKPGGRGIGLYLAKVNLNSIGYDIFATNDKKLNRLNGACFVIEKVKKEIFTNEF